MDQIISILPKAIGALVKLVKEDEEDVLVQLTTVKLPKKLVMKPTSIRVPHALMTEPQMCIFVKDSDQPCIKSKLESLKNIKVISITKLKKNFKAFEQKRMLCASYDLFMADERILTLLPTLLGKTFFEKKRIPIPVDFKKDALEEINRVLNSVYLFKNKGVCNAIKVAKSTMSAQEIQDNIEACLPTLIAKLGDFENIQAIHLKTSSSVALPLFNQFPL